MSFYWFELESFALHPSGKVVAVVGDSSISLWSIESKQKISEIETDFLNIENEYDHRLEFTPDGKSLLINLIKSNESKIFLWPLDLDYLIAEGCKQLDGYLRYNPDATNQDRSLCGIAGK